MKPSLKTLGVLGLFRLVHYRGQGGPVGGVV
jgi:hypothetical protein